eukprot:CAMPEP_0178421064 /NCGR_PEP_ID=MMETSP0689_2-20121128/26457_1 /TAXON_ID=160604 /ORGANISM="Amphidinium massartii, Strain CS-259" /LENGTH=118 /DNA_ID=CAMNT_0020042569 /DNA_START=9 /DNA_END=365 /DNA_ORIENTATION=+
MDDGEEEFEEEAEDLDGDHDNFELQEEREELPKQSQPSQGPRKTTPYMTKFEKARVLGARALQISMNAPVMVELDGETDPLLIAEKELIEKAIPFVIRRYLPDGTYEDWKVSELLDVE